MPGTRNATITSFTRKRPMAENKTKATDASVDAYLAAIADPARRSDCEALARLMAKVVGQPPKLWGTSIVGFGSYHYKYASGREGDSCLLGFASRRGDITLYGLGTFDGREELLSKLGKHKTGKGCVYVSKMSDIDIKILEQILKKSVAESKKVHE
jgi:hypothetical protein